MNRIAIAILGSVAGAVAALLLTPSTRGRIAEVGETMKHGVNARLRATPLIESGQELTRQLAGRAQDFAQDVADKAQEAVGKAKRMKTSRDSQQVPTESAELAVEAAERALAAVDDLVNRARNVLSAARKRVE